MKLLQVPVAARIAGMKKILIMAVLSLLAAGCASNDPGHRHPGDQESEDSDFFSHGWWHPTDLDRGDN